MKIHKTRLLSAMIPRKTEDEKPGAGQKGAEMQEQYITERQAREMNALLASFFADPVNAAEYEKWKGK